MSGLQRVFQRTTIRTPRFTMSNFIVGGVAVTTAAIMSMLLATIVGTGYAYAAYGGFGAPWLFAIAGLGVGLLYATVFAYRREYTIPAYLRGAHRPSRIFLAWNAAFLAVLVIAFLTQTTVAFSRATVLIFYAVGLIGMIALEISIRGAIIGGLRSGTLQPRRVMLIGARDETAEFMKRLGTIVPQSEAIGVRVVATAEVTARGEGPHALPLVLALDQAVTTARALLPDEIVLLGGFGDAQRTERIVRAFEQLPVAIHLDPGPLLSRFGDIHLRRVGGISTLSVAELPLAPIQVIVKRIFDIVGAALGLLVLSPLFAIIALAIKRDSPGDVFFLQDRRGFNQETFKIFKFRTMTTTDNGPVIHQARPGDPRVTRVGRFLRATSLDELPQLINVLKGDMSLVGPRPHAVAHDQDYETRIRQYPRRLNMKPGITGWAQVNGLRGLTETDEKMRQRVEADLYYIDNWSIALDVYILLLTVCSPKTFRNAL